MNNEISIPQLVDALHSLLRIQVEVCTEEHCILNWDGARCRLKHEVAYVKGSEDDFGIWIRSHPDPSTSTSLWGLDIDQATHVCIQFLSGLLKYHRKQASYTNSLLAHIAHVYAQTLINKEEVAT